MPESRLNWQDRIPITNQDTFSFASGELNEEEGDQISDLPLLRLTGALAPVKLIIRTALDARIEAIGIPVLPPHFRS